MTNKIYFLDTFSMDKFKGNPTPVCVLNKSLESHIMHSLAIEFNAPVTVFVEPPNSHKVFPLRYFTSTGEIPACGHATLGASFVIFNNTDAKQITFETIEKIHLSAKKENNKVFIKYPKYERTNFDISQETLASLNLDVIKNHFFCTELESLFIEVQEEEIVKQLQPDFERLKNSSQKIKELVVMSKSKNKKYDFALRSFCPWIGIDEDPVTGSVHSVLGHYWQENLNKTELIAYQNSERGGYIYIKPLQDSVEIGGYSNIIVEGSLLV